jgi:AraC-like DNA-binding protein
MALCATLSRDRQNILEIRPDFLDHQAFLPVSRPSQVSIATDLKSTEYSRRLGVGKARRILAFTSQTVDQIARTIRYEDTASFRSLFYRVGGFTTE